MRNAVNSFQKNLFVLLLYSSAFFGVITDVAGITSHTPFYAAFDGLMILLGVLSLAEFRGRLVFVILFIITCIIINLSYTTASFYTSLNGTREIVTILAIVIFYSKLFAQRNEEVVEEYLALLRNFAFIFLISQIPVAFVQFLKYGPSDAVGGTFGNKGSGVLTLTVICLVYFLHHFTRNFSQTVLLYMALIPLLLNETKISFVLIPMMILFIWFKPKIKNIIMAAGAAALFFFIFDNYYSHGSLEFDDNATGIFSADFLNDYLMADMYAYDDVPRFTKIVLGWQMLSEQTNTFLFGFEYGLFKGGDASNVSLFSRTYDWLLSGTKPYLFFLMMQGGILLATGFLWLIAHINKYFLHLNKFKLFLILIFFLILGYSDAFRNQTFATVYFFLAFYVNSKIYSEKSLTS